MNSTVTKYGVLPARSDGWKCSGATSAAVALVTETGVMASLWLSLEWAVALAPSGLW